MNEEIKKKLELELEKKGLNKGLSQIIHVEKAEDIERAVTSYIELHPQPKKLTFDEMLKDKELQAEFDRRMTKALDKVKKKSDPEPEPTGGDDDTKKMLAELLKKQEASDARVRAMEARTEAEKLFNKSETLKPLAKIYLNRIDHESETSIEEQIKSFEAEVLEVNQVKKNQEQNSGGLPNGSGGKEATADEIKKIFG